MFDTFLLVFVGSDRKEQALAKFFETDQLQVFKEQLFPHFLTFAPAAQALRLKPFKGFQKPLFGEEFLKQSSTRILFIADKITSMTLEIYRQPTRVVEEASANGLRHVGYGVPTEMFPPFVSAAVETPPEGNEDLKKDEKEHSTSISILFLF